MSKLVAVLLVAAGGAVGSVARHLVDEGVRRAVAGGGWSGVPLGTVLVNVAGCFLLALLAGLAARGFGNPATALLLGTGFLGGLTTFSTFGLESYSLASAGRGGAAAAYLLGNLVLGIAAVALGWALASLMPLPGEP